MGPSVGAQSGGIVADTLVNSSHKCVSSVLYNGEGGSWWAGENRSGGARQGAEKGLMNETKRTFSWEDKVTF